MEELSLTEIAEAIDGQIKNKQEINISNISIDTRTLQSGDLFIALIGDNFDGHQFVADAFEKGAKAAIVSQEIDSKQPLIEVEDTTVALQELARYYRKKFAIPVIGVTGSTGKTTTKDIVASALSKKYKVLKTAGNFNNEIGLPLTLFRLDSTFDAAVVEMGMRGLGQIEQLAQIAEPNLGIVTNVGVTHIELLKSQERIAQAKSELVSNLGDNSVAILNGDDEYVKQMASLASGKVITYGLNQYNQIRAANIENLGASGLKFDLVVDDEYISKEVYIPAPGEYNVYNALAAICVGIALEFDLEDIKDGLEELKLTEMRNQILESESGFKIINDAYNANPTSMEAALNTLEQVASNRKIAILGDMLELGEIAKEEHNKVGKLVADKRIDYLVAVGELASEIAIGAEDNGMKQENIFSYLDKDAALKKILKIIKADDTILVKGSRGMKLEQISYALQDK
ncbi:UDP-N-acetylmuramoyl-tripeptide--D-alanyl-D-alanine ligase [Natroniella sulfidigena]|uniref:UDP-N-acetylmuramoyl-tripeptide--D-alanyl-D- alanine ligase n=1 Tax=Natroniella sulfidigena TaxID=723921 RepID=UPI00200B4A82|nr:UDP-N-acetylmuramoyl-tripeptide--D-alanyl-D-alanine ligase [Natroniella sulfidigena]MCK8817331.1 UDP-N-acetylmuramoyl-tripeptide--D-alanyl-D-alanine ligase [Natroniella sulfidigena]